MVFIPVTLAPGTIEHSASFVPFATAVAEGAVTVTETSTVQSLNVTNDSPNLVLGLSGTYLRGGGQDRAFPMSVLVPAHASGEVPVRCVEQGRWRPSTGQKFRTADGGSLAASQMFDGTSTIQQGKVWASVETISQSARTTSNTKCHGDTIAQLLGNTSDYTTPITSASLPDRTVGGLFLVYLADRRMHCAFDVFGRQDLFRFYFPKLCESVALTAVAGRLADGSCDYREGVSLELVWRTVFHNLKCAKLFEEKVPFNAGQLLTKSGGKSGCSVSLLKYQGQALHGMLRWDALCT